MEGGSSICHVLALLNVNNVDDNFHFNETRYKWTDSEFLLALVNPNWDVSEELLFPLYIFLAHKSMTPYFAHKEGEQESIRLNV